MSRDEVVQPPPSPDVTCFLAQAQHVPEAPRVGHHGAVRDSISCCSVDSRRRAVEEEPHPPPPFTDDAHGGPSCSLEDGDNASLTRR